MTEIVLVLFLTVLAALSAAPVLVRDRSRAARRRIRAPRAPLWRAGRRDCQAASGPLMTSTQKA
jgi:hypothetical protein